jgi:hypothetical protein
VQQSFHILNGGGKGERAHGGDVAVESHHVIPPGWQVVKHEDLSPPLGAQVEQLVAGAAQETGKIKSRASRTRSVSLPPPALSLVQLTLYDLRQKKGLSQDTLH